MEIISKYLLFINANEPTLLTYNEVLEHIEKGKVKHATSIRKQENQFWTKAGVLMEFREALTSHVR